MSSRVAMNLAQCSTYVCGCASAADGTRMFLERETLYLLPIHITLYMGYYNTLIDL